MADGSETLEKLTRPQAERRQAPRHRLTLDISPDLHRRILTICATRGQRVNEAVREVLERSFPA